MRLPLPLETSYASTRLKADNQRTLNLFRHSSRGYRQFPGLRDYVTLSANVALTDVTSTQVQAADGPVFAALTDDGADRGAKVMGGILYVVSGPSLYSINGTTTAYIGAIANSPNPVVMAEDGNQLCIATGSTAYAYTTGGGLVTNSDSNLSNPKSVAYINSRFLHDKPNGIFQLSDIDDGTSSDALDFAEAESFSDGLLRVYALNQIVYMMGEKSIEVWYFSGVGRPPLDRQGVIEHGIISTYACDSIDDTLYFIDHNRRPSMIEGAIHAPMLIRSAIGAEWDGYSAATMEGARVQAYSFQQENFIDFIFPGASKIWTYHEPTREFFQRTYSTGSVVKAFNLTLMADHSNGKIYELDSSYYKAGESSIVRTKDTSVITSELFQQEGFNLSLSSLFLTTNASSESVVNISISKDLDTFSTSRQITIPAGNRTTKLTRFGKFREALIRIETESDSNVDILDLAADMELMNG